MTSSRSLVAVVLLVVASASAWGQLTKGEHDCQQSVVKQGASFLDKKIKCLVTCDKRSLKGKATDAECQAPYAGKTLECVTKVETKTLGVIVKQCGPNCPKCYAGGNCTAFTSTLLAAIEDAVDFVVPLVRCNDSASADGLTKGEATVRQKVALTIAKFVVNSEKCLTKCRKGEAEGKIPAHSCDYGNEVDAKTVACLITSGDKALDYVEDPDLDAPECLKPNLTFALPNLSGLIDRFDPLVFCGSPSPAFLDQPTILR